jgi:hypothetical protein
VPLDSALEVFGAWVHGPLAGVTDMLSLIRAGAPALAAPHLADLQRVDGPLEVTITGMGTLVTPVRREDPVLPPWRPPRRTHA